MSRPTNAQAGTTPRAAGTPGSAPAQPVRSTAIPACEAGAARKLARDLGTGPHAALFLFVSPRADAAALARDCAAVFRGTPVIGCTTAGEIAADGYRDDSIVAVALSTGHFAVDTLALPDLDQFRPAAAIGQLVRRRQGLAQMHPEWPHECAFVMVDGLSAREDQLVAALAAGLGPVPLFGGSAGDGVRFERSLVLHDGRALRNAAVVALIRSAGPLRVFNADHVVPTDTRMVVTAADPARRIVHEINAEPAAAEYARLIGIAPAGLGLATFAAHPLVVRAGGRYHVRAIRETAPAGGLIFFSAIEEGMVLTLAEPRDMLGHLERQLADLSRDAKPLAILGCDCILRRIEAEGKQQRGAVSALFAQHGLVGFSTYGEQVNGMHVNQTLTGVAFYPAEGTR